jgi:hypothetical protein
MGLKGIIEIPIICAIMFFGLFFVPFLFIANFKYHLVERVTLSYEYNTADLSLLELLAYNKTYRYLSEKDLPSFGKYVMPREKFIEKLNNTLKLLAQTDCYNLTSQNEIIVSSGGDCELKDVTWAEIFVPYNPKGNLIKKIALEVGR